MATRNVLFVCSKNRLRSLTAETVFAEYPNIDVASAGLNRDSDTSVSPDLLRWADIIFVMESSHRTRLSKRFRQHLKSQRVICLDVADRYKYMDPELVSELKSKVGRHL